MDAELRMKRKGAPVIGFLAARFDEPYQNSVWRAAAREAERVGAAIVFFGGQRIGSPIGYEALDNIAFDLAEHSRMAGLVVMSNVIGTYISNEEQLEFLARFKGTGVVTIGIEFPGIPSVLVDASGGMSSIAEHLMRVHGRSRFLFLAGPRGHLEAEARKAEFLRAVASLATVAPRADPASPAADAGTAASAATAAAGPGRVDVLYGDFTEEDARDKVSLFLDSGRSIDAIVAANDLMAVGAMRALADRRIDVPREVSVTGFDDTEDSRFSVPPLTTVRQPASELGRMAVDSIAARLGLIEAGPCTQPPVSFVVRESCGCPHAPEQEEAPSDDEEGPAQAGLDPPLHERSDVLAALSAEVNREIRAGRNPSHLRGRAYENEVREGALLAISEGECRFLASQRFAAERRVAVLSEIEASLVSSFGIEDILKEIARGSRELGISGCWLCLFVSKGAAPEWSKLFLVADARGTRILSPYGLRFRCAELVPGGLPGAWSTYVCTPLRFGDDRLGYLICTADSIDRRIYEALRDQVSSALKGAMLMAAERDRERSLERNVRLRTLELSTANARLVDEMARRKVLERELLDISNRIMGKIGQDIHDNLCQDIAGLGIMAAVLEGKLRRAGLPEAEAIASAAEALASDAEDTPSRAAALASAKEAFATAAQEAEALARGAGLTAARAKDIARGLYPAELEARGILSAVERLVGSSSDRDGPEVRLEVSKGFAVRDSEKALHLYRIVQEALANARRHSRAKEIKVGLYMDRETVSVEVSDDGVGIPPLAREESGMGLHILKYRASVIGGELRIRSRDSGTTVTCRIPR
jgi:DNA-binding LacI/PurR family transcriptional regulator/signal transduction histidine kinase